MKLSSPKHHPYYSCYGRIGQTVSIPVTGNRAKRVLHGVINIHTGAVLMLITTEWVKETHQAFLHMIREHWRGWNIVLFEDRGTPHTADDSLALAASLNIEIRLLPRAAPELNSMDHLWRWVKGRGISNQPTVTMDETADQACQYIFNLSRRERLEKAGILSANFWLTF